MPPAMLEDPEAPTIYRRSGEPPYPGPSSPLPEGIVPRQVTLRDHITVATAIPFSSPNEVPASLLAYLCSLFNAEVEDGNTYPHMDTMPLEKFGPYWFGNFGAVMILGDSDSVKEKLRAESDEAFWEKNCLGSFYIKPNYPGRSSHVCNAGFIVGLAARGRGVGKVMGATYLVWAPKLGYSYSVFNLVYETNVASCRIWDSLGFKRIGRVKGCGNLRSYPNQLIDAIIYGRELGTEDEEEVYEERFDKIRYYLRFGKYPDGADRAEKSRLRSAATHYRLVISDDDQQSEKLMLKDKEVVSDPQRQYEIAAAIHAQQHGGINKTTAVIAEKFHWVRIKETVSAVIKNCVECREFSKPSTDKVPEGTFKSDNHEIMEIDPPVSVEGGIDTSLYKDDLFSTEEYGQERAYNTRAPNGTAPVDPRLTEFLNNSIDGYRRRTASNGTDSPQSHLPLSKDIPTVYQENATSVAQGAMAVLGRNC